MLLNIPGLSTIKINPNQTVKLQRALNSLYVGQILQADVITTTASNRLTLNIEGQKIQAQTSHRFKPGDSLQVKVKSNGKIPELIVTGKIIKQTQIQQALRQVLPHQIAPKQILNTLSLMSQTLVPDLQEKTPTPLEKIPSSIKPDNPQGMPLPVLKQDFPKKVHQVITQLINSLSNSSQISNPNTLKQSVLQSGQFLENNLISHSLPMTPAIGKDYKAQLFNLLRYIDSALLHAFKEQPKLNTAELNSQPTLNTPTNHQTPQPKQSIDTSQNKLNVKSPQLLKHQQTFLHRYHHDSVPLKGALPQPMKTEGPLNLPWDNTKQLLTQLKQEVHHAIARVQANQLNSIPGDSTPTLLFDLPVRQEKGIDVIPFMIEEKDIVKKNQKNQKIWSVMLAMSLEQLGEMQIKVSLNNNDVHVNFWSPNQQTLSYLSENQTALASEISSLGLTLENFKTYLGLKENEITKPKAQFLDIKI